MAKIAKMMTRVVLVGKMGKYDFTESPFVKGTARVDCGKGNNIKFTVFNKDKEGVMNPHTNASDINANFSEGDLIYITGQDNRSTSDKDTIYEDIMVWDYRAADEDEIHKAVFVYVADVKDLNEEQMVLSYITYRDEEIEFPIDITKCKIPMGLEVGDRVKVKGTLFNGLVTDFYGDGEFKTVRTAAEIKIENTRAEIEEEEKGSSEEKSEGDLW